MKSVKGGMNATAAAVNLANILSSSFSNVKQVGFILLVNNANNKDVHTKIDKAGQEDDSKLGEIRLSRDGELLIGGRKVDPNKPIQGYRVFMDTKKSASK